jgi:hypothetical protein
MQASMKRSIALLLLIAILVSVIYVVNQKNAKHNANRNIKCNESTSYGVPLPLDTTHTDPAVIPTIRAMPNVLPDNNDPIANFPDVDRQPLIIEYPTLLPANEATKLFYKDWPNGKGVETEMYSNDAPLFNSIGEARQLIPPDINSSQRRVGFYSGS